MKKKIALLALFAVVTASTGSEVNATTKSYRNCEQLNRRYPKGVAKSRQSAKNTGAKVSPSIYKANKRLDRDKDGIVCEQDKTKSPSGSVLGSFGPGTKIVGPGVPPGRYMTTTANSCYWERLSGFGGTFEEILANDNPAGTRAIVDVLASDKGFNSNRCGNWYPFSPQTLNEFGAGTYAVGTEMPPGTWTATFSTGCYWERLSSFDGELESIISNGNPQGSAVVTILPSDVGFSSNRCGVWTKIG